MVPLEPPPEVFVSLLEWLQVERKTVSWLAEKLGITHQAIYSWLGGATSPRAQYLIQIEKLSGGRVTPSSLAGKETSSDA